MASFITTRANFVQNGTLALADVPKVLSDTVKYPEEIHESIINLLERFKMVYRLGTSLLIPSMLPTERPGHLLSNLFPSAIPPHYNTVGRVWTFPSLPLGFFERFEVAVLSHPKLNLTLVWKRGLLCTGDSDRKSVV